MLVPGDPGPGGIQVASLAPPSARWIPRRQAAARPRHVAARPTPPARVSSARPNVRTHKIRQGDTLFSLAKQYGTTVDALRALNNLKGNALKVGGQLRVPGTNAGVEVPERCALPQGRRSGPAKPAPRGPDLARPRFGVAGRS